MNKMLLNRFLVSLSNNLKSKIKNLTWLGLSIIAFVLVAAVVVAEAQQPKKIPRIRYLGGATPAASSARLEPFRKGLRELGYIEGKNIVIEWRSAEGKLDRLPALVAELMRLKVDVIVTAGPSVTMPLRKRLLKLRLS